jgi:sRNA-binding regulator protein Hfq
MNRTKYIAAALVVTIAWTNTAARLDAATEWSNYYKEKIETFGPGTEVEIELHNGKRLRGAILDFNDVCFDLMTGKRDSPLRIAFENVKNLQVTRVTIARDSSQLRTVLRTLGNDGEVKLRLASGKKLKGRIHWTREEEFDLVMGRKAETVTINYHDVDELWPLGDKDNATFALPPPQPQQRKKLSGFKKFCIAYAVIMMLIIKGGGTSGGLP